MSLSHLTDFSDRLSPMLVKELRQGLRAKTFIAVFLSLQIFLAVMMFSATAASSTDQVGGVVSGIIFGFFAVAVLLVQPLRGISALSSEVKGNTLDMMALTRLSASKIVIGKWVAIISQTALLLSTIVPYLILRYFFGGMNLLGELVFLSLMFLTSITLTAITVGLSGCSSVIIRSLLPIFGLPVLLWTSFMMATYGMRRTGLMEFCSMADTTSRIAISAYVLAAIYLGYSMLSLGSSLIAPAAENHSIPRRLMALVAILFMIPIGYLGSIDKEPHMLLVFLILVPALVIALTESAPLVPTVCEGFVKRGIVGRIVGWFFYPCWSSGILFAISLGGLGVIALAVGWHPSGSTFGVSDIEEDAATVFLALIGGLFFPSVWQMFFFRGDGQRIANYLLLLVGSGVMLGVLALLSDTMHGANFLWFFAWNPLAFIPMVDDGKMQDSVYLAAVFVVDLVIILLLLIRAVMDIRNTNKVIQDAETSLAETE